MKVFLVAACLVLAVSAAPGHKKGQWYPTPKDAFKNAKSRNLNALVVNPKDLLRAQPLPMTPATRTGKPIQVPRQADCGLENPDGISKSGNDRVVGGTEAANHQFPWLAYFHCNNGWLCTSSIVDPNWIMTAGHCVDDCTSGFEITVGVTDVNNPDSYSMTIDADYSDAILYEGWNPSTLQGDIAMVQVPTIELNEAVRTICLPSSSAGDFTGDVTTVAGWGKISDNSGGASPVMNYHEDGTPVISNDECASTYGTTTIQDGTICIDSSGATGVCSGDSGGSLNHRVAGEDNTYEQIGVTSFVASLGCESGLPHGFTRVTYYLDWIMGNIGKA